MVFLIIFDSPSDWIIVPPEVPGSKVQVFCRIRRLRFRRLATGSSLTATRRLLERRVADRTLITEVWADDSLDGAYARVSLPNTRTGDTFRTMISPRGLQPNKSSASIEWLDINGHTGRYESEDGKLRWYRDVSENLHEVGTESNLNYERRDDLLVIYFTLPNGDRYDWTWQKLE